RRTVLSCLYWVCWWFPLRPTRRSYDLRARAHRVARASCLARQCGEDPTGIPGEQPGEQGRGSQLSAVPARAAQLGRVLDPVAGRDRKSTRLNSSHVKISYAVLCLK